MNMIRIVRLLNRSLGKTTSAIVVMACVLLMTGCAHSEEQVQTTTAATPSSEIGTAAEIDQNGLEEYVGEYGVRKITLRNTTLEYYRDGMPSPVSLKQIGDDLFEFVIPAGARVVGAIDGKFPTIRFNRQASGKIESFTVINPDGSEQGTSKRDS